MIRFGIIGLGYWGPNYARILARELPTANLAGCADTQESRLRSVSDHYPSVRVYTSYQELLRADDIDAIVVSTPSSTHYQIVNDCLEAGKHVLVEKPMAMSTNEATRMIQEADFRCLTLMVGHTFLFNPAVRWVKRFLDDGSLGRLYYLYFQRTGLGPIRADVNALWDLAPHDVSMLHYWLGQTAHSVTARGEAYLKAGTEDIAFLTLRFSDHVMASVHVSWLDPVKTRRITIIGDRKMIVFDDTHATEKLRIYDKGAGYQPKGADFAEFLASVRDGDVLIPRLESTEPLKAQLAHFVECVATGTRPLTDGTVGREVVAVLERAQVDMDENRQSGM